MTSSELASSGDISLVPHSTRRSLFAGDALVPEAVLQCMRAFWKIDQLRAEQATVIMALLARKDVISVLPTGFGKSLTYQLPSVHMGVCSLVVTPLLALMTDQVEDLRARGINAVALGGDGGRRKQRAIMSDAASGSAHLLYLSPERLCADFSRKIGVWSVCRALHGKRRLGFFVVDEAHCLSEWGADFRRAYRHIDVFRSEYPD